MSSFMCKLCEKRGKKEKDGTMCSGVCNGVFHLSCVGISEYDKRLTQEKECMLFHCIECQKITKQLLKSLNDIQILLTKISEVVEKKINDVNPCSTSSIAQQKSVSFANVLGNEPPIVIAPKNTQNSDETKKAIRDNIDPQSLSLKVKSVTNRKDGAIAIKCVDTNSREKIEHEVSTKWVTIIV